MIATHIDKSKRDNDQICVLNGYMRIGIMFQIQGLGSFCLVTHRGGQVLLLQGGETGVVRDTNRLADRLFACTL